MLMIPLQEMEPKSSIVIVQEFLFVFVFSSLPVHISNCQMFFSILLPSHIFPVMPWHLPLLHVRIYNSKTKLGRPFLQLLHALCLSTSLNTNAPQWTKHNLSWRSATKRKVIILFLFFCFNIRIIIISRGIENC